VATDGLDIHGRRLCGCKGARGGKENGKKLKRIWPWRFTALIGALGRKGEVEEAGRCGGDLGGRATEQRKGRGHGIEESTDRWGRHVSDRREKEKKRGG
jgi:hypothetical protein